MSQKQPKPTLGGRRIRTRKRDEKVKYEPQTFRDEIIDGINKAEGDLKKVSDFLDVAGSSLNYRFYADVLLDVLIAGGMLAPGGSLITDCPEGKPFRATACVFLAENSLDGIRQYVQLFNNLIRRYKYLQKSFEDEIKKVLQFLKGFSDEERKKLAMFTGLVLSSGMATADLLLSLWSDHLIKPGISLAFATEMFRAWLTGKDIESVGAALKKSGLNGKLKELFPGSPSMKQFEDHFTEAGLTILVAFQKGQEVSAVKREMQAQIKEMIENEETLQDIEGEIRSIMAKNKLPEQDVIVLLWRVVMTAVEWNKKEELVADQALKHLKAYCPLFAAFATQGVSELTLMVRIQDYCYDNMVFLKVFQKIILLFYKTDVLSEDCILKWYKEAHSPKGKTVLLEQMKKMVEWLQNASEESDSDDGGDGGK
ncbi:eIF5-mimic protein 2-like isoform X2 [Oscarella lobularis]|uniref:eIF5-mimic protein 2-like isoform X2 n=1 Tax=Oscarella lobularis TaxID=121494 RepID=UPI0033136320